MTSGRLVIDWFTTSADGEPPIFGWTIVGGYLSEDLIALCEQIAANERAHLAEPDED